jgi:hypothetical protein
MPVLELSSLGESSLVWKHIVGSLNRVLEIA